MVLFPAVGQIVVLVSVSVPDRGSFWSVVLNLLSSHLPTLALRKELRALLSRRRPFPLVLELGEVGGSVVSCSLSQSALARGDIVCMSELNLLLLVDAMLLTLPTLPLNLAFGSDTDLSLPRVAGVPSSQTTGS